MESLLNDLVQTKTDQRLSAYQRLNRYVLEEDGMSEEEKFELLSKSWKGWIEKALIDSMNKRQKELRMSALNLLRYFTENVHYAPVRSLSFMLRDLSKKTLAPGLERLVTTSNEGDISAILDASCLWKIIVKLIGPGLHHGSSLLNSLLVVIRPCFTQQSDQLIVLTAYGAWRALIDNFSMDPAWSTKITEVINYESCNVSRRLILILKVLRGAPCKSDMVALEKYKTWLHLICSLGGKLESCFGMVCYPLLRFCIGGTVSKVQQLSIGMTGDELMEKGLRRDLPPNLLIDERSSTEEDDSKSFDIFKKLQISAIYVVGRFVGVSMDTDFADSQTCFNESDTVEHYLTFVVQVVRQWCLFAEEDQLSCSNEITQLPKIWMQLLQSLTKIGNEKKKIEAFQSFCSQFRGWLRESQLPFDTKMLCIMLLKNDPLISQRRIHSKWMLDGFISIMIDLSTDANTECLKDLLSALVKEMRVSGLCMDRIADFVTDLERCNLPFDVLINIWTSVARHLIRHLQQTNEITSEDEMSKRYVKAFVFLQFPFGLLSKHPTVTLKSLSFLPTIWKSVYAEIERCICLDAQTVDSACCRQFCLYLCSDDVNLDLSSEPVLSLLVACEQSMLDSFDFSTLLNNGQENDSLNESMFRPLGDLLPFVRLLSKTLNAINAQIRKGSHFATVYVSRSMVLLMHLFSQVQKRPNAGTLNVSLLQYLSADLAQFITVLNSADLTSTFRVYVLPLQLDRLVQTFLDGLMRKYGGPFDSQLLSQLSELLISGLHSRPQIRINFVDFWKKTFAKSSRLECPPQLRKTLTELKSGSKYERGLNLNDKYDSNQPYVTPVGSVNADTMPLIDEEDYCREFNVPILRSGSRRLIKTELNRTDIDGAFDDESAGNKKTSPLLNENEEEFVVIKTPDKAKKMALTEHQKEKLSEKQFIPDLMRQDSQSEMGPEAKLPPDFTLDSQPVNGPSDENLISPPAQVAFNIGEHNYGKTVEHSDVNHPTNKNSDEKVMEKDPFPFVEANKCLDTLSTDFPANCEKPCPNTNDNDDNNNCNQELDINDHEGIIRVIDKDCVEISEVMKSEKTESSKRKRKRPMIIFEKSPKKIRTRQRTSLERQALAAKKSTETNAGVQQKLESHDINFDEKSPVNGSKVSDDTVEANTPTVVSNIEKPNECDAPENNAEPSEPVEGNENENENEIENDNKIENENENENLLPMEKNCTPEKVVQVSSSVGPEEALTVLDLASEVTPGILKKTAARMTSLSTGAQTRRVHFGSPNRTDNRRISVSTEKGAVQKTKNKRPTTPPAAFYSLFQERTQNIVKKARSKTALSFGESKNDPNKAAAAQNEATVWKEISNLDKNSGQKLTLSDDVVIISSATEMDTNEKVMQKEPDSGELNKNEAAREDSSSSVSGGKRLGAMESSNDLESVTMNKEAAENVVLSPTEHKEEKEEMSPKTDSIEDAKKVDNKNEWKDMLDSVQSSATEALNRFNAEFSQQCEENRMSNKRLVAADRCLETVQLALSAMFSNARSKVRECINNVLLADSEAGQV